MNIMKGIDIYWSFAWLAVFIVSFGCTPLPGPVPLPDSGDATTPIVDAEPSPPLDDGSSPEARACVAMTRLGCVVLPTCAATIRHINQLPTQFDHIDTACIIAARTYGELPKCGVTSCNPGDP